MQMQPVTSGAPVKPRVTGRDGEVQSLISWGRHYAKTGQLEWVRLVCNDLEELFKCRLEELPRTSKVDYFEDCLKAFAGDGWRHWFTTDDEPALVPERQAMRRQWAELELRVSMLN
jgi:hypothetical protein